jgi:hypothetical protein
MVDDRLAVKIGAPSALAADATLDELFASTATWYDEAGLRRKEKRVRNVSDVVAWGAELEGGAPGLAGPIRAKLLALIDLTGKQVALRNSTEKIEEALEGFWGFNFQFRRPLYSLLWHVYKTGAPERG